MRIFFISNAQHVGNLQLRSEQAREWADGRRAELLEAGQSFVSETVFSHESKLALIEHAQHCGFVVVLPVVCLDDPKRLLARVQQRVQEGGHAVPAERILALAETARDHWGVENRLHWVLDVTFREDECRVRTGHAPRNLSTIRKFALTLLRQDQQYPKRSLRSR